MYFYWNKNLWLKSLNKIVVFIKFKSGDWVTNAALELDYLRDFFQARGPRLIKHSPFQPSANHFSYSESTKARFIGWPAVYTMRNRFYEQIQPQKIISRNNDTLSTTELRDLAGENSRVKPTFDSFRVSWKKKKLRFATINKKKKARQKNQTELIELSGTILFDSTWFCYETCPDDLTSH